MTNEQLCALAVIAIEDREARFVLKDALEESGWWDARVVFVWGSGKEPGAWITRELWLGDGPTPGRTRRAWWFKARALAAVLLFGEWPTSWPLAERCRRPTVDGAVDWPLLERFFGSLLPE